MNKYSQTKKVYWIGGSPCSGKTSIASILSEKYGLFYYQADNYFDNHLKNQC